MDETLTIVQVFQIHEHDTRLLIFSQIVQQIDFIDVGLVAKADEFGEADALLAGIVEDRRAQGARLGHEGDLARLWRRTGETGIELHIESRVHHTEAIGAQDADVMLAGQTRQFLLSFDAIAADLFEAGHQHNRGATAGFGTGNDRVRDSRCGHGDHCQFDRLRGLRRVSDTGNTEHGLTVRIDRQQVALVATLQILEDGATYGSGTVGCANDSDTSRRKQCIESTGILSAEPRVFGGSALQYGCHGCVGWPGREVLQWLETAIAALRDSVPCAATTVPI